MYGQMSQKLKSHKQKIGGSPGQKPELRTMVTAANIHFLAKIMSVILILYAKGEGGDDTRGLIVT